MLFLCTYDGNKFSFLLISFSYEDVLISFWFLKDSFVGCKCLGWHVLFCSGSKKYFPHFWRSYGVCGVFFIWFVWPLWVKCNDKIPFSWAILKICLFVFNFLHFGYSCYRYVLSGSYYAYVLFSFACMFISCLNWKGLKSLFVPTFFQLSCFPSCDRFQMRITNCLL